MGWAWSPASRSPVWSVHWPRLFLDGLTQKCLELLKTFLSELKMGKTVTIRITSKNKKTFLATWERTSGSIWGLPDLDVDVCTQVLLLIPTAWNRKKVFFSDVKSLTLNLYTEGLYQKINKTRLLPISFGQYRPQESCILELWDYSGQFGLL